MLIIFHHFMYFTGKLSPPSSPSSSTSSSSKVKRNRQAYTRQQTNALEIAFCKGRYLTRTQRIELSKCLDLNERQIKIWFQNRRMKQKITETKNEPLEIPVKIPLEIRVEKPVNKRPSNFIETPNNLFISPPINVNCQTMVPPNNSIYNNPNMIPPNHYNMPAPPVGAHVSLPHQQFYMHRNYHQYSGNAYGHGHVYPHLQ